jgi:hypothetical protein
LSRGRVIGVLLVIGPVILLVFLPTVMGLHRYVVADDAMAGDVDGSIGKGSVALTREVAAADLVVGDVIAFRPPADEAGSQSVSVTRRIVSIDGGVARTRGDNMAVDDAWRLDVSTGTFPRVVLAVPWVGQPFAGEAGQGGWLVLVGAIVLLLLLALVAPWRRVRERRRAPRPPTYAGVR